MIVSKVLIPPFPLINKLFPTCWHLSQLKCMFIYFAALGNMVFVMRPCFDELSVVITVLDWSCPISARVTQRSKVCLHS